MYYCFIAHPPQYKPTNCAVVRDTTFSSFNSHQHFLGKAYIMHSDLLNSKTQMAILVNSRCLSKIFELIHRVFIFFSSFWLLYSGYFSLSLIIGKQKSPALRFKLLFSLDILSRQSCKSTEQCFYLSASTKSWRVTYKHREEQTGGRLWWLCVRVQSFLFFVHMWLPELRHLLPCGAGPCGNVSNVQVWDFRLCTCG